MKKKAIIKPIVLALMLICVLAFVSCSFRGCGKDKVTTTTTVQNPPIHEHSYNAVVTAPTFTEQGYTTYTCDCGDSYLDDYVPVLIPSTGLNYTLNDNRKSYSVTGIGTCTDENVIIPSTYEGLPVTSIGTLAFSNSTSLTSVIIPDSVTSIDIGAFNGCTSLAYISIPDSVTSIGALAFDGCALKYNEYANALYIGNETNPFYALVTLKYDYMTSCTINTNTKVIVDGSLCVSNALTKITVDKNNQYFESIDGNLYTKDGKTLIQYAIGKKENTFNVPSTVTSIASLAFRGCNSLTNIKISEGVMSIGISAFAGCSSLMYISIPDGVTVIETGTFSGCTSLESITIPDSVSSFGFSSFGGCSSLTSVNFEGTVEQWQIKHGFELSGIVGQCTIYCTNGEISKDGTVTFY